MKQWLQRARGALGMGLIWGAAWGVAGGIVTLGFVLTTGSRPDAPFPIVSGVFGFISGLLFSAVLRLGDGRRGFGQLSLPRVAAWGGIGGLLLSAAFALSVFRNGDPGLLHTLPVLAPLFAIGAACSAAGSLALARRARDRTLLEATRNAIAVRDVDVGAREALRDAD